MDQRFQIGVAISILLASFVPEQTMAQDKSRDPTFNGILKEERCGIYAAAACADGYCADFNPEHMGSVGVGTFVLDFPSRLVTTLNTGSLRTKQSRMEIVDVSEPLLNKPLWVKFKFESDALQYALAAGVVTGTLTGIYVLAPVGGSQPQPGTYIKRFGMVGTSSKDFSSFGISGKSSVILGGSCN
jgi:hypothetical protein